MNSLPELLELLNLKKDSNNDYLGVSQTVGSPNVFGGQVIAQALNAAIDTVEHRHLHSLHAYFLEAGDLTVPIKYTVDRVRDGGSFSTRRVTAIQHGKTIFIMALSFHKTESGYNHQIEMKSNIKQPEDLLSWNELLKQYGSYMPNKTREFLEVVRPIEFKPTVLLNPLEKKDLPPYNDVWFKLKGEVTNLDYATKQQILAYISDYSVLTTAINPHASKAHFGNTQMASLDHSMWFFRDFDFSDWLLFSIESPSASNARAFTKGNIFTREGTLVASVAQEGLMRPKS
ncbi:acyl-CoA thioesterase II [Bizionia gelidisalsuginis]|uniref:Acyl-CoA thioesterase 2 n=2 Tax=Bizionia TaxID=283785 RepID=A0A8H2QKF9_9FLAO|nr:MULTISPECIES: acyl-CoA thioesterase II [Bizionia]TYB78154.1 acyl-CoA thioesterase II [Bizionia saleffrena]TYC12082.1 acyl-CoA thioesterase II [Bizionia gelidisalsuginis]